MGLFSSLFSRKNQGPPPGMFPPMMPPPGMMGAHRMAMMGGGPPRAEELAQRVTRLENDLDQASAMIEALAQLLEESGGLAKDAVTTRAKALLDGEVPAGSGPPSPVPKPSPADLPHPVQPVFKKPFVAKRKWDEAAEPPGKDSK